MPPVFVFSEGRYVFYLDCGIQIFSHGRSVISPGDFDKLADHDPDWIDVTEEYDDLISKIDPDSVDFAKRLPLFHTAMLNYTWRSGNYMRLMGAVVASMFDDEGKAEAAEAVNKCNQWLQINKNPVNR